MAPYLLPYEIRHVFNFYANSEFQSHKVRHKGYFLDVVAIFPPHNIFLILRSLGKMAIRFSSYYIQSIINHYVYVTHPLSLCIFGGSVIKIDFSSGIFLPVSKNMGRWVFSARGVRQHSKSLWNSSSKCTLATSSDVSGVVMGLEI